MEKLQMNTKYLIIGVLGVIIVLLCLGIAYTLLQDHTEYVTANTVANGTTMEIPNTMAVKSNNTDSGIVVLKDEDTIVITFNSANKGLAQVMAFADIKLPIFGTESEGNVSITDPTIAGSSLSGQCTAVYVGSNDTNDNIIVISKKPDIVDHIIKSIKWKKASQHEEEKTQAQVEDSKPSAYAYKADGTPMYSQDEVSKYMEDKYGKVNYHVGDNGYIDMDEPGYDDAGHRLNSSR